jgi:hypothetical protein
MEMSRLADAKMGFCQALLLGVAVAAAGVARAIEPSRLAGEWVGERSGREVVWRLDGSRMRVDGRPADFVIAGDSLRVRFDRPCRAEVSDPPETAIYRFVVNLPASGTARLFVYGFDLGNQGMWLERAAADPPLPEGAAPTGPAPPTGRSAAPDTGSSSVAATGMHPTPPRR